MQNQVLFSALDRPAFDRTQLCWLNRLFSRKITSHHISGTWLTALILFIHLTLGNISKHRAKEKGMCHWHWRYKTSDISETKESRAKVTTAIETRVGPLRPIDWWQIWKPRVNFGLLFRGAKFFHNHRSRIRILRFFSFLKFYEFYDFFRLKKIRKKFVILQIIDV